MMKPNDEQTISAGLILRELEALADSDRRAALLAEVLAVRDHLVTEIVRGIHRSEQGRPSVIPSDPPPGPEHVRAVIDRALARLDVEGGAQAALDAYAARVSELGTVPNSRCRVVELDPEASELAIARAELEALARDRDAWMRMYDELRAALGFPEWPSETVLGEARILRAKGDWMREHACWHCGDCLEPPGPPRCEGCPAFEQCDVDDCDEPGCVQLREHEDQSTLPQEPPK